MAALGDIHVVADVLDPDSFCVMKEKGQSGSVCYCRIWMTRIGVLLQELDDEMYRRLFRFERHDMERLPLALQIPELIKCRNGTLVQGTDALHVLLRRLSYPNRLIDISIDHWKTPSEAFYIVNKTLDILYDQHAHLLHDFDQDWLAAQKLREFADVIRERGAPLANCWGFIDGTARAICRPIRNQRLIYSGHKRLHCYKFQSASAPNGTIVNLYGPVEGRRHDAAMLRMSGLLDQLEALDRQSPGYMLYGDPAYLIRRYLLKPFRGAALNAQEAEFNRRMSRLRVSVEWTFGKIISNFAFLDFKKKQKLYLQPVAKYYIVAAILTNCHTCLYGSQTGSYFGLQPPTLQQYLQLN